MAITKKWSALKANAKLASTKKRAAKSNSTATRKDKPKAKSRPVKSEFIASGTGLSTKKKDASSTKRASKKSDTTTILKTTTITSEFPKETHKNKSRAMPHRMLHDAREDQSLYKDMIDQLYPLMTQAKRAKEGAVGWEGGIE